MKKTRMFRRRLFLLLPAIMLCTFIFGAPTSSMAAKRALLVGINNYKNLPFYSKEHKREIQNLKGAVREVSMMREKLIELYGFSDEDIKVLTDSRATRKAILEAFEDWLIKGTKPGDMVFFHFSGHGTQVPDEDGDEINGFYEAICAYDVTTKRVEPWSEAGIITDAEIDLLLKKLEGRNAITFVDSCHANAMGRRYWILSGKTTGSTEWNPYITDVITRDHSGGRIMNCRYYYSLHDLSIKMKEDVELIRLQTIGTVAYIDNTTNRLILRDELGVIALDITDTRFRKVVKNSPTTKENKKGNKEEGAIEMIMVTEIESGNKVKVDFKKERGKYVAIGIDKIVQQK
ncbi:MAG: caspase family protein [Proteobacteria bacterium]|nr:caspase family protein [Pseudomonadota bacterium]